MLKQKQVKSKGPATRGTLTYVQAMRLQQLQCRRAGLVTAYQAVLGALQACEQELVRAGEMVGVPIGKGDIDIKIEAYQGGDEVRWTMKQQIGQSPPDVPESESAEE